MLVVGVHSTMNWHKGNLAVQFGVHITSQPLQQGFHGARETQVCIPVLELALL